MPLAPGPLADYAAANPPYALGGLDVSFTGVKSASARERIVRACIGLVAVTAVAGLLTASGAAAQPYPSRPVRVITSNSPGGTSDIFMRALADELQKQWGQPVIIENRSGGAMNIAGRACAEAANDGYTICILPNETLVLNQFTFKSIPFDPEKDFEPITNAFINTQVLVVSATLNVSSLDDLAALSRAKPGTLSYSALAIPMQITMEKWKQETGADLVSVPSRGGGDIVTGLLTGTTPVAIVGLPNFIAHIRSGTVKALAVDSDQRSALFPDIPTLRELGFPNLGPVYFAFVAPAGTPKPIIQKLYEDISRIGNEPTFRKKRLIDIGIEPVFDRPERFGQFLQEQRRNAARLIRESGFAPQ
jgi:tripartite-type tricarboxylate transporter receptor subunit TctC